MQIRSGACTLDRDVWADAEFSWTPTQTPASSEMRAARRNLPAEGCECIPRHPTTLLAVLAPGSARITTESTSRRSLGLGCLAQRTASPVRAYSLGGEMEMFPFIADFSICFLSLLCSPAALRGCLLGKGVPEPLHSFPGKHGLIVTSSVAFAVFSHFISLCSANPVESCCSFCPLC